MPHPDIMTCSHQILASAAIPLLHRRVSLLAALDVHPRVGMQILRHSKIAVTMEIYTEIPSAATREALKKLGEGLGN
jgi:hypothetical protein